jgi:polar amino acid transport system substrate-binding protein
MLLSTSLQSEEIKAGIMIFPPYFSQNENKEPDGIYLKVMEKTLRNANLEYRIDIYPAKRLYLNLGNGKTHLYLGIKGVPEYDDKVLYSTTKVAEIKMRIYANADTPLPVLKKDINHHRIGIIRGYSYGGLINYFRDSKNNIDIASTAEHLSSFKMLKNRRVDYVINYQYPSETVLENLEIPGIKYTDFYSINVYFIVSKFIPDADKILDKVEKSYLELLERGEIKYMEPID